MLKLLHMANRRTQIAPDGPFASALRELGELVIVEQAKTLSEDEVIAQVREADVVITNWATRRIPDAVVDDPGKLKYVLNIGGTCKAALPVELIRKGIPVTNWGDTPGRSVAEGAMTLLLAVMKDMRGRVEGLQAGKGGSTRQLGLPSGTLRGTRVGLYGCGVIGRRFVTMIEPFNAELLVYDPYADDLPKSLRRVDSLDALCEQSEVLVIWAGLSEETKDSVTAARLAKLPDHGVVINTARGEIIDQDALFAELKSGRLRAGLDVMVADNYLPAGHEAHTWPNLIITCHEIVSAHWPPRPPQLSYGDKVALDNLKRFIAGEPLRFVMDESRYHRSS